MAEDEIDADPPVLVEGELFVGCSSCDSTTTVPTEIDGVEGDPGPDGWELTFTVRGGRLAVHEAYCPEHRIGDAIDELAVRQDTLAKSVAKTLHQAKQLTE